MGLEGTDHPVIPQGFYGGQQGPQLPGVVGVVVIEHCTVVLPFPLKAAARPGKGVEPLLNGGKGHLQLEGGPGGGQGVAHIVDPRDLEGNPAQILSLVNQVEGAHPPLIGEVSSMDVPLLQAEGEYRLFQPLQGVHGVGVVPVGNDRAPLRHQLGKPAEGVLHVLQILEKVQVVRVHIQNHRHGGEKGEEGVAVLTGLQNDGVPLPHPVSRPQGGKGAPDHHRGVPLGGQENLSAHGGGGGLSVGARHTQGVLVVAHDGAPGLRPLKDGDAGGAGGGNFGVVVVDRGGADDAPRPLDALSPVADDHGDSQRAEMLHRLAVVHIRTGDCHPRSVEHLGQGGHGHAADAHQMGVGAGPDISMDVRFHSDTPQTQIILFLHYSTPQAGEQEQNPAVPSARRNDLHRPSRSAWLIWSAC